MPTNTFYNLSDDKKQRIFDAAVMEFSARRFTDASINQIIKNAGIPKGSFYQYFKDKEDLYFYTIQKIDHEKREIIFRIKGSDSNLDVLEMGLQEMKALFEWSQLRPDYSRIFILMWSDNSQSIAKYRASTVEWVKKNIELDKACGLIKPEVDSDLVADMLITLFLNENFLTGLDEEMYLRKFNGTMKILKEGFAVTKK